MGRGVYPTPGDGPVRNPSATRPRGARAVCANCARARSGARGNRPGALNMPAPEADPPAMDPFVVVAVLAAAAATGILALGVAAARIDDAQRLAALLRETRRLRVARVGIGAPPRTARRRH